MNNKYTPKITIITPTLNSEKFIESCILSVSNQNYLNKEHIIIDGLSKDSTIEIVRKYQEKFPHIKLISEKDDGIYDAMNKGIEISDGDWIYFLGSDDVLFDNDVLNNISKNMLPELDVLYGNVMWGESGDVYDGKFSLLKLRERNICHQAMFFNKNIFEKLGKLETEYRVLADWVFNIKWMNNEEIFSRYVDTIVAKFSPNGFSSSNKDSSFEEQKNTIFSKYFPKEFDDLDKRILKLEDDLTKKDCIIKNLNDNIHEKDNFIKNKEEYINSLINSTSWKITFPIRFFVDCLKKIYRFFKNILVILKDKGLINSIKKTICILKEDGVIVLFQKIIKINNPGYRNKNEEYIDLKDALSNFKSLK